MKLQCGYEDFCKAKSCLECRRFVQMKTKTLTLAEATCIEDFGTVDIEHYMKDKPEEFQLAEKVMLKLNKKVKWG